MIYDPIAHLVWSNDGWLHNLVLDFAGGSVVHTSAGFSALAAAIVIGKRLDFVKGKPLEANNVPIALLGAGLLWFGWFGFNSGSAVASSTIAVNAFVCTNISAAAAALVWMCLHWTLTRKPNTLITVTGAIAGLVSITPASGFVSPLSSIAIGLIGGLATYVFFYLRSKHWDIDDTLDVWAVHGVGGVAGMLLTGVFASLMVNITGHNGLLFGNPMQLLWQFIAVTATAIYSFFGTYLLLKLLSVIGLGLRVERRDELMGLDLASDGQDGYRA